MRDSWVFWSFWSGSAAPKWSGHFRARSNVHRYAPHNDVTSFDIIIYINKLDRRSLSSFAAFAAKCQSASRCATPAILDIWAKNEPKMAVTSRWRRVVVKVAHFWPLFRRYSPRSRSYSRFLSQNWLKIAKIAIFSIFARCVEDRDLDMDRHFMSGSANLDTEFVSSHVTWKLARQKRSADLCGSTFCTYVKNFSAETCLYEFFLLWRAIPFTATNCGPLLGTILFVKSQPKMVRKLSRQRRS